jgi:hypothetical protein
MNPIAQAPKNYRIVTAKRGKNEKPRTFIDMKDILHSVATAFATKVLPVPTQCK